MAPRLRALRRRNGTTLVELAHRTGIPVSTLSRLESGHRRPTLERVLALAQAYSVSTDQLLGAPPTGDPRVTLRPVTRNGKTLIPLTHHPGGIHAYELILPGSTTATQPELNTHEGYEWLYVLNGQLRQRPALRLRNSWVRPLAETSRPQILGVGVSGADQPRARSRFTAALMSER